MNRETSGEEIEKACKNDNRLENFRALCDSWLSHS